MAIDPISALGAGGALLGGVGGFGTAMGWWKSPQERAMEQQWERESKRRAAIMAYMQGNLPQFQAPAFDPSQYEDVLEPIRETQGREAEGLRNMMALQGGARGGVQSELMRRQLRRQSQDYANRLTGMKRDAYQRYLQEYDRRLQRAGMVGQYAG